MVLCGRRSSPVWDRAGLRSKWPDVSLWTKVGRSSPMRASTGSSALRWPGRSYSWRHYLPRAKSKLPPGAAAAPPLAHRVPLNQRPPEAADRSYLWRDDACTGGPALLALSERHPAWCSSPASPASMPTSPPCPPAGPPPPGVAQTITFDNGTDAHHYRLHPLGTQLLLRYLLPMAEGGCGERHRAYAPHPAPEDGPGVVVREAVYSAGAAYNNTPRKCLGYRTPAEIFLNQVALEM